MNTITYKGVEYPTRTFVVNSQHFNDNRTYTIATISLFDAISKNDKHEQDNTPEQKIDNQIYFYLEDELIDLSGTEICEEHLDIPMRFLAEIED